MQIDDDCVEDKLLVEGFADELEESIGMSRRMFNILREAGEQDGQRSISSMLQELVLMLRLLSLSYFLMEHTSLSEPV